VGRMFTNLIGQTDTLVKQLFSRFRDQLLGVIRKYVEKELAKQT